MLLTFGLLLFTDKNMELSLTLLPPPTGGIIMWVNAVAPTGWLMCDGAAYSRTTYAALFALCGTTYGAGDGSTTFNIPDCRQRFIIGKAAAGTGSTLGGTGGVIDHTHNVILETPDLNVEIDNDDLHSFGCFCQIRYEPNGDLFFCLVRRGQ